MGNILSHPSSSSKQTQLTFDNVRTTITASQSDETIPATGESDSGQFLCETPIGSTDAFHMSSNSGSNYATTWTPTAKEAVGENAKLIHLLNPIGNSTGRYKWVASATAGSRIFHQMVTTLTEEA